MVEDTSDVTDFIGINTGKCKNRIRYKVCSYLAVNNLIGSALVLLGFISLAINFRIEKATR